MKGLIKKDLFILKNNSKSLILLLFVYLACSINADGIESFIIPFMMAMLGISTFSYDEYNKWDAYAITMIDKRSTIIKSKYITGLLLIGISFIVTLILSFIIRSIRGNLDLACSIEYALGGMTAGLFVLAIMFPLIIKFGLEKGRIAIMLFSFGLAAIMAIFAKFNEIPNEIMNFFNNYFLLILPFFIVLIYIISYLVSQKIYSKKEF